jgi:hypothetical protein
MTINEIAQRISKDYWKRDQWNIEYFDVVGYSNALVAELAKQGPVAEVHAAHLRKAENGEAWCREVLLYSGNNPGDFLDGKNYRVKLYTAPIPPVVPEGWKLVPIEPTTEMINAGMRVGAYGGYSERDCYTTMLAAAPTPKEES